MKKKSFMCRLNLHKWRYWNPAQGLIAPQAFNDWIYRICDRCDKSQYKTELKKEKRAESKQHWKI
ncbi:MAG: hypothetical protein ACXABY_09200 [Candidatus Thorarchaeota archaeon]|jgi:hypothetical protein